MSESRKRSNAFCFLLPITSSDLAIRVDSPHPSRQQLSESTALIRVDSRVHLFALTGLERPRASNLSESSLHRAAISPFRADASAAGGGAAGCGGVALGGPAGGGEGAAGGGAAAPLRGEPCGSKRGLGKRGLGKKRKRAVRRGGPGLGPRPRLQASALSPGGLCLPWRRRMPAGRCLRARSPIYTPCAGTEYSDIHPMRTEYSDIHPMCTEYVS